MLRLQTVVAASAKLLQDQELNHAFRSDGIEVGSRVSRWSLAVMVGVSSYPILDRS